MDSTYENLVPVFDVGNQTEEALIRTALEESGIHFMIVERENLEVFQSEPFYHHSQVRVLEHEVEKAKEIIEQALGDDV